MLIISEAVAKSALMRTESRGGHTREDYPDSTDEWEKVNIVVRNVNGEMQHESVERAAIPDELKALL